MPMIKIDEKDYDFDSLPETAKAQLTSLQIGAIDLVADNGC